MIRPLGAALLAAWAAWRRGRGLYDRRTLALRWLAFRLCPSEHTLLQWALCRRDFGRPLPSRWRPTLSAAARSGSLAQRRRVQALLQADTDPGALAMSARRERFQAWWATQAQAPGGACVVGNAAGLRGARLGAQIDAHGVVVRFNAWRGPTVAVADTGSRVDVWVCASDCEAPPPQGIAWAIVSGPDPQAMMGAWPAVRRLELGGVPMLTVPLSVWRDLVATLQAPPSAGLLLLAWLRCLGGGWEGLKVAGIGWAPVDGGRHHLLASNRSVGRRHRWGAERALVEAWRDQGLKDLQTRSA